MAKYAFSLRSVLGAAYVHLEQMKKNMKMISLVGTTCKIQLQKKDNLVSNVWKKKCHWRGRGAPTSKGKSFFHCCGLAALLLLFSCFFWVVKKFLPATYIHFPVLWIFIQYCQLSMSRGFIQLGHSTKGSAASWCCCDRHRDQPLASPLV